MRNTIRLTEYTTENLIEIFHIADDLQKGKYKNFLEGKTVIMFFPASSLRTRVTFEKGIYQLGGQTILFPPETLDKKEKLEDVTGYLNNWADAVVVRHSKLGVLEEMAKYAEFPVINAMTEVNHPCEILSDLYSLSKIRNDFRSDSYLFVGAKGNIGGAWTEAANAFGLNFRQCCPPGYEMDGVSNISELVKAVKGVDIICTDSLPSEVYPDFKDYQITVDIMKMANNKAILNPCPPFYRGEEVSEDVIGSEYFVGYNFKKYLLEIQQAILIYNLTR
ncbi:peptide transporter [Anaerocolumna sp. AGMB13020]|uniref:ornithine carbamoyltransferase n=1 Tax=Anaerocolumna sp. AGMB13020 TaxID=3081750 RepID=UPI0029558444|nr:peptide transporter [Anaerocolumna sp. AGMB13020]WOO36033.1 peptide transporter [Anaerocolumna sp. AGMB13020]